MAVGCLSESGFSHLSQHLSICRLDLIPLNYKGNCVILQLQTPLKCANCSNQSVQLAKDGDTKFWLITLICLGHKSGLNNNVKPVCVCWLQTRLNLGLCLSASYGSLIKLLCWLWSYCGWILSSLWGCQATCEIQQVTSLDQEAIFIKLS